MEVTDNRLVWEELRSYSTRRRAESPTSGLMGSVVLQADDRSPFWPWLVWGQFVHVDDYRELRVDRLHRDQILAALQGKREEPMLDLGDRQLRQSKVSDPQSMAESERALALWYKQRLLAFYFSDSNDKAWFGRRFG